MSVFASGARVEVIIPFQNQGAWLAQACRSLQHQTEPGWRALLINDHSAPEAVALAERICRHDPRFQLLHLSAAKSAPGPWLARNLGIERATAPLVAFLDADDLWHPQKLERQLALHATLAPHPSRPAVLSVCGYHRFQAHNLSLIETRHPPEQLSFQQLLRGNVIPLSTVIVDRDVLLRSGGFRGERHEDYGLWLRLFAGAQPPLYRCLREPLMAYRLHGQSLSAARHRSVQAVNRLFRQHLPRRRQRWPAVLRWGWERGRQGLGLRLGHRIARGPTAQRARLPEPFFSLIVQPISIAKPETAAAGADAPAAPPTPPHQPG